MDARSVVQKFLLWWALPTTIAGAILGSALPEPELTTYEEVAQAFKLGVLLGGITMAIKAFIRPSAVDALLSALALGFPALLYSSNVYVGGVIAALAFAVNGWRALKVAHERKSREEEERQAAESAQRRAAQQSQNGLSGGDPTSAGGNSAVAFEALVGGRNGVDWRAVHSQEAYARMLEQLRALADSTDPQLRARGEIGLAQLVDAQFAQRGVDMPALVAERLANPTPQLGDDGPYVAPPLHVDDAPNGILEYLHLRQRNRKEKPNG